MSSERSDSNQPPHDTQNGEKDRIVDGECGDEGVQSHLDQLGSVEGKRFAAWLEEGALGGEKSGSNEVASKVSYKEFPLTEGAGDSGMVIGPYKILQEIGEGGFGIVYMASQTEPVRRRVAFKIIKPGMDTRQVIARFEAERQALALMQHPNIAMVLDAGTTSAGRPFFVMELVRGISFVEFCDRNQFSTRRRLKLFLDVCDAIQHAHQKGVIHRDIKPSNILVTLHDGKPIVKVIDFGIAKALEFDLTDKTLFTNYGQRIGTPIYMSPEQAETGGTDVDTRSDVYSLGVLLYELVTGRTPLQAELMQTVGYDEFVRRIIDEAPEKPSTRLSLLTKAEGSVISDGRGEHLEQVGRIVKGDLDWIVLKALEKERERRYQTVRELSEDIGRFLDDEPVLASPPSRLYQFRKFSKRHRRLLASGAAILLVLIASSIAMTALYLGSEANRLAAVRGWEAAEELKEIAEGERARAEAETKKVDRARSLAEAGLYAANLQLAASSWQDLEAPAGDVFRALVSQVPAAGGPDPREFAWRHLWNEIRNAAQYASQHSVVPSMAFLGDDSLLLYEGGNEIQVWNGEARVHWQSLDGEFSGARGGHLFSPRGDRLVLRDGSVLNRIMVFSATGGELEHDFHFEDTRETSPDLSRLRRMVISSDGQFLCVTAFQGGLIGDRGRYARRQGEIIRRGTLTGLLWDLDSGELTEQWPVAALLDQSVARDSGWLLAVSPDGHEVAFNDVHRETSLLLVEPRRDSTRRFEGASTPIRCVAYSIDGDLVSAGTEGGRLLIWDRASGTLLNDLYLPGSGIGALRFSGTKRLMAAGMRSGLVAVIDRDRNEVIQTLKGEISRINNVAFSPDETYLAATNVRGYSKVWALHREERTGEPSQDGAHRICFSSDGSWMATLGRETTMIHRTDRPDDEFSLPQGGLGMTFSPDNRQIAVGGVDNDGGRVTIYNLEDREARIQWSTSQVAGALAYSPDGQFIVVGGGTPLVRPYLTAYVSVFRAATGELVKRLGPFRRAVILVKYSADGHRLFAGSHYGDLRIWETRNWKMERSIKVEDSYYLTGSLALSPDEQYVAAGVSRNSRVIVRSLKDGALIYDLGPSVELVTALAFSPDGSTLAGGGGGLLLQLWDLNTGIKVRSLHGHKHQIRDLDFSPNGVRLTSVDGFQEPKNWEAPDLSEIDRDPLMLRLLTDQGLGAGPLREKQNLDRYRHFLGDSHPDSLRTADRLAMGHLVRGSADKAMDIAREFMKVADLRFGRNHQLSGELKKRFIAAWHLQYKILASLAEGSPSAAELLEEIPDLDAIANMNGPEYGTIHQSLGELFLTEGDFEGVVRLLNPVLEERRKHWWDGPSAFVGETAWTLGQAHEALGASHLAASHYREVMSNVSTVEEYVNWRAVSAANRLAKLTLKHSMDAESLGEAEQLWRHCIEMNYDRYVTAEAAEGLTEIYQKRGDVEEAARWRELAKARRISLADVLSQWTTNLLSSIDLQKDTLKGSWETALNRLRTKGGGSRSQIQLGEGLPEDYRVTMRVRWIDGEGNFVVGLPCGSKQGMLSFEQNVHGFYQLLPRTVRWAPAGAEYPECFWGQSLRSGEAVELVFIVVRDRIEVHADGQLLRSWKYRFNRLSTPRIWRTPAPTLFVGLNGSAEIEIDRIELEALPVGIQ